MDTGTGTTSSFAKAVRLVLNFPGGGSGVPFLSLMVNLEDVVPTLMADEANMAKVSEGGGSEELARYGLKTYQRNNYN